MKFGLFGAATAQRSNNPDVDSAAGFKDYIDYVIEAESLGYESVFIVEHHFTGFGQVSATLNLLTWIGAKTSTIRLGTAVIVLPWHNPVLLAEQAATVDLLSGGRLDFGIGKGYRHNEFASFRIPMEEGQARFEEAIDIITKSWVSNERFDFKGQVLGLRRHHGGAANHPEAAPAVLAGRRAIPSRSAGSRRAGITCCWISSPRSRRR
jgi:alkanesulfonate monooxygenase SsuD/methylene tetrahydromethanopterin reductase-like flavin-dependent oxidoreductase (luciferase family)